MFTLNLDPAGVIEMSVQRTSACGRGLPGAWLRQFARPRGSPRPATHANGQGRILAVDDEDTVAHPVA
mgnify:CR=1 FL=1